MCKNLAKSIKRNQNVLAALAGVTNLATNILMLVANLENLGALAPVSGEISCPELCLFFFQVHVFVYY